MKKILIVFAALSLLLCAATAQANLITNGSFDEGLGGWSNLISSPAWDASTQAAKFGHGNLSLPVSQSLYQNLYIAPGTESLTLSFDISIAKSNFLAAVSAFSVTFNSFDLSFEDFLLYNWKSTDDAVTTTISTVIDFNHLIGFSQNAALFFNFTSSGGLGSTWIQLDNVMLTANSAVPVPAAVWLLGSGLACMAALRRKMN